MSALQATFPPWLQVPMEAGAITPAQAWALDWEILVLQDRPWTPGVLELSRKVALFHIDPALMRAH